MNPVLIKNSAVYDTLKFIAQIVLPAAATLYFALCGAYNWDNGTQVVGTITAVDLFLGTLLGLSTSSYSKTVSPKTDQPFDGTIDAVVSSDGSKQYTLNFNGDPAALDAQDTVSFKVNK